MKTFQKDFGIKFLLPTNHVLASKVYPADRSLLIQLVLQSVPKKPFNIKSHCLEKVESISSRKYFSKGLNTLSLKIFQMKGENLIPIPIGKEGRQQVFDATIPGDGALNGDIKFSMDAKFMIIHLKEINSIRIYRLGGAGQGKQDHKSNLVHMM
jgi:hypothetical protein